MFAGFNMVVLLAAMHAIPADYLDAARVDGAGSWQRTLRIMVPLLWPTIINLVILDFIGKMKQFALGLGHDTRWPHVGHRDRRHLRRQARLRVENARPRLPVRHRRHLVRHHLRPVVC
jgi:hypothetical protein